MSLFVKVKDSIIRKDNISVAYITEHTSEAPEIFVLKISDTKGVHYSQGYPTLKQARFALNKLHRDLEGETESW